MKLNLTKRIIILVLAILLLVASIFLIRFCSAPPKYEEIEARFKQLIEDSYEVNVVLFGEGLPTYPHVTDPKSSTQVIHTGEYTTNSDGEEVERLIYYYYTLDEKNKVLAHRDSYLEDYAYALLSSKPLSEDELKAGFPKKAEDENEYYREIYASEEEGRYCYSIPYEEPHYDFYYTSRDDEAYDYVSLDAEYRTVEDIKKLAESVYSFSYTSSLYTSLFDGISSGGVIEPPRYLETTSSNGTRMLAQSNTYEAMNVEKRVFLFETAKINKLSSNKNLVRIEIDSYLPSNPDKITNVEITLIYENGDWYLNNPSF